MIKVKNGNVTLKGDIARIMTDLAMATKGVNETLLKNGFSKEDAEDFIKVNVEIAIHPEKMIDIALEKIINTLDKILGETEEDEVKEDE